MICRICDEVLKYVWSCLRSKYNTGYVNKKNSVWEISLGPLIEKPGGSVAVIGFL